MTVWLLKLHRWVALIFAVPLLIVLGTGLVLSFEPSIVMRSIAPGSLTTSKIEALLAKHDAGGQARGLNFRSYEQQLAIGAGRGGGTIVDVRDGTVASAPGATASVLTTARRMHETLLLEASWLVIASTAAMLVLVVLGMLMGWPRFSNSLSGWHKGTAWVLLPLIVLSPLTALFMAGGVTFAGPQSAPSEAKAPPLKLIDAVRVVGQKHDLSNLVWLRPQRGQTMVRLVEGGEYRVYAVTAQGTVATARNWPRLWHEGNFAGHWSVLLNVITSVALLGLLVTGVWMWARTQLRRRARQAARAASPA